MTERVKDLAQCNDRIRNFFETGPVQRAAIEEFAELIVKECMVQCEQVAMLHEGMWDGARHCTAQIKEHFGVEL